MLDIDRWHPNTVQSYCKIAYVSRSQSPRPHRPAKQQGKTINSHQRLIVYEMVHSISPFFGMQLSTDATALAM